MDWLTCRRRPISASRTPDVRRCRACSHEPCPALPGRAPGAGPHRRCPSAATADAAWPRNSPSALQRHPPPVGDKARPPARAPGRYRRLTHAHAGATGVPGKGLQHQSNFPPRTVHRRPVTTGQRAQHNCVPLVPPAAARVTAEDPGRLRPAPCRRREGPSFHTPRRRPRSGA